MLREYIPAQIVLALLAFLFPTPHHLLRNQIRIDDDRRQAIRASVRRNYHQGWRSKSNYSTAMYEADVAAHTQGRLDLDRRMVIPWLDRARRLRDSRILEIGCGTGSSTVALAEQGAEVTGIDIDHGALAVARDRCAAFGVKAELHELNAAALAEVFHGRAFDFIIFFASLEHMTIAERLAALRDAWSMLPTGGLLAVVETPNRLWYFDNHTSWLPFFHWLPDELAFLYSSFSPRENFRELYREYDATAEEHFLRRGRGMSFHEFDLAIRPVADLHVVSSLSTFQGTRYKLQRSIAERRYKSILRRTCPDIHEGFCDDNLFLIIEKD
jgi:2-polyprenyl-3-methyl-5-hydroxy-6-metoxy-1,4-benzoquinol methylase